MANVRDVSSFAKHVVIFPPHSPLVEHLEICRAFAWFDHIVRTSIIPIASHWLQNETLASMRYWRPQTPHGRSLQL